MTDNPRPQEDLKDPSRELGGGKGQPAFDAAPENPGPATDVRNRPTTIERAFQLAQSGQSASLQEIRARLGAEGYSERQIEGPSLIKQLRKLIAEAKPQSQAEDPPIST